MTRILELLRLVESCGTIEGRKKLQKMVHILQEAGHPFSYRYGYHFHGPFSAELKRDIDSLVAEGLLDEHDESRPGEYRQYKYASNAHTRETLEELCIADEPAWKSLAHTLNAKSAQELEAISTVLYLSRRPNPAKTVAERFRELKPHLEGYLSSATTFAASIGNQSN